MAAHGFRRSFGGRLTLRTDETERGILADLVGQLLEFVTPEDEWDEDADPLARLVGIDATAERPEDPALRRLFPDAYADDDEASTEFRRFTERSLREVKMAHARTVTGTLARSGDKLAVDDAEAQAWLGTLNYLRLTLGSRLQLDDDSVERLVELSEEDPAFAIHHVYDWLTFLQESLVHALTGVASQPPPGAEG